MRIDIWSDVVCPFCYIGKRQLEHALASFAHKDAVEIVWHSYQLDPATQYQEGKDLYDYLAERKGQSRDWSVRMHHSVTEMAKKEGLNYNFDIAKPANSFDAHRIIQYAKIMSKGDAAEERLFKAYFTEGAIISDHATLVRLAAEAGLDAGEVAQVLTSGRYADEVNDDIARAAHMGVNGVPFFVFDNKYAISGAQGTPVFTNALEQIYKELHLSEPDGEKPGATCTTDGDCA